MAAVVVLVLSELPQPRCGLRGALAWGMAAAPHTVGRCFFARGA